MGQPSEGTLGSTGQRRSAIESFARFVPLGDGRTRAACCARIYTAPHNKPHVAVGVGCGRRRIAAERREVPTPWGGNDSC